MSQNNHSPSETSSQDYQTYALALFSEMNEHVRSTENKYATVSVSYLSLITFISSLAVSGEAANSRIDSVATYVLMILVGCTVIVLQRWYRIWKEHYLQVCRNIYKDIEIPEEFRPFWMREKRQKEVLNADDALSYFTNVINVYVVLRLCGSLVLQSEGVFAKLLLPVLIVLGYILFIVFIRANISKQKYLQA